MSIPTPRQPRDPAWLTGELARLQQRRSDLQDEILVKLAAIDAVTDSLARLLDEYADAIR